MGILGNTIESAMRQRDWQIGLKQSVRNYQDKVRMENERRMDRERELAKTEFDYLGSQLADPEKRLRMDAATVEGLLTKYQSAAGRLKATGLDIDAVDPDPIPTYISATISKMQTDPHWRNVRPVDRYNYLAQKFGKHWYQIEADFINTKTLQDASQPQVVNQAEIDKASKANYDKGTATLAKGGGPVATDFEAVPDPVMTTPLSTNELKGNQMFGAFYDGDVNPKVGAEMLGDRFAAYTKAAQNPNTPPELVQSMRQEILSLSDRLKAGITETDLDAAVYAISQPRPTATEPMDSNEAATLLNKVSTMYDDGATDADTVDFRRQAWESLHPGTPMPNGWHSRYTKAQEKIGLEKEAKELRNASAAKRLAAPVRGPGGGSSGGGGRRSGGGGSHRGGYSRDATEKPITYATYQTALRSANAGLRAAQKSGDDKAIKEATEQHNQITEKWRMQELPKKIGNDRFNEVVGLLKEASAAGKSAKEVRKLVRKGLMELGIRSSRALNDYSFSLMRQYYWGN